MQHLIIVRHAEADHAGSDFERPLTVAGVGQARRQGAWLSQQAQLPELVLSSPAARARQTAEAMLERMTSAAAMLTSAESIYEASAGELIDLLAQQAPRQCVMLVGHNPGVGALATVLTGEHVSMHPASLALLAFGAQQLEPNSARLLRLRHCDPR